jgi:putative DNA methylase
MTHPIKSPRKLIEVALPLDAINAASAREKSIRHGHPSTLHLWWARRPLATARAVIFAQLVNDPGYQQGGGFKYGMNKKDAEVERKRLFKIIEDLVLWENTTNEEVLERARAEIRRSWREVCELNKDHPEARALFDPDKLPPLHDPFAGGGTIPLEAQRLGLEAYASDLNPVAVLINKAMIEIPPKFAGRPPVNPEARKSAGLRTWKGAEGLAEDVRYYGKWMRDEAQKRIGHLYPPVEITEEMARDRPDLKGLVGERLTVVAWVWARTVRSPSPAFADVDVPLTSTFMLSAKAGSPAHAEPVISAQSYQFVVKMGSPADPDLALRGTRAGKAQDFRCLMSGAPLARTFIREEAKRGRMGARMMAIVAESRLGRVYLSPSREAETIARCDAEASLVAEARRTFLAGATPTRAMITGGVCSAYGLSTWGDLFTPRQTVGLTTLSDLVTEARERLLSDLASVDEAAPSGAGWLNEYANAVAVYLALSTDRLADRNSSLCGWDLAQAARGREATVRNVFARQALPMTWDFAEVNLLADTAGSFDSAARAVLRVVERLGGARVDGVAVQADATSQTISNAKVISTDPPYYDNIGYADLSDFFYAWLRRALRPILPSLFSTMTTPKAEELVATTYRHGTKDEAERFFLSGMTSAMQRLSGSAHVERPITIYYAFKESETRNEAGTSSSGWETFLQAVLSAGLSLSGTWPVRTELSNRMIGSGTNALASSIVLVCRKRPADAPTTSRREFLRELNRVLPEALDEMTKGAGEDRSPVAPVDLSQAIIGPGMAVFSKYAAVLEADGSPMTVKTALQLINRFLAEDDFDADTQFCLHWFEQHGWGEGAYGEADVLARAKATSVSGVAEAGVAQSGSGKVRLYKWAEYPADWDPATDRRLPVWEALHQLVRALRQTGESGAGALLAVVKDRSESIRQLAYRLYTLCERQGWAEDARAYNELVTSWLAIEGAAATAPPRKKQLGLFEGEG